MLRPYPVSLLQFGLYFVVAAIGAVALIRAFAGRQQEPDAKRDRLSTVGIVLQGLGFGVAGFGPIDSSVPWSAPSSIVCSALFAGFGGSAIAIFIAARRAMGKNWSVVARTRSDHELVRRGPFAVVRHPIYLALLLYLLSFGIAFGHFVQVAVALPLYTAGTLLRARIEERLLGAQFGEEHARYVREVPAFIPLIS